MAYNGQPMILDDNGKPIPQLFDATTGAFVPITTGTLFKVEGLGGGGSSMEFRFGATAPANTLGNDGDLYINSTGNNTLYKKTDGAWVTITNLKGTTGATGTQGIQGVKGDKGDKGDTGATGARGADGFPTQTQWDALVARVTALETT